MKKEEKPPKAVSNETENTQEAENTKNCGNPENKYSDKGSEASVTQAEDKVQELTNLLQRLQAEFENYKKRVDKEQQNYCKFANADIIIKILPILDSFELALISNNEENDFVKGIEMIYSQFFDVLEKQGLKQIDALNKKFDPHMHEVLLQQESEGEPNIVIEVLQKGYTLNERLIRTAKVKLSKNSNKDKID